MAFTGLTLASWTVLHLLGNLLVFAGPETMNRYGAALQGNPVIWLMRAALLFTILWHMKHALITWRTSRRARRRTERRRTGWRRYRGRGLADQRYRGTTLSARGMAWGGLAIAAFTVFHLLHIYGPLHASFIAGDVFHNQVTGFRDPLVLTVYLVGTVAFAAHLRHGLYSALCTLGARAGGARGGRARRASLFIATAVGLGYAAPCVSSAFGWVG